MRTYFLIVSLMAILIVNTGCIAVFRSSARISEIGETSYYGDFTAPQNNVHYRINHRYYAQARVIPYFERSNLFGGIIMPYTNFCSHHILSDSSMVPESYVWVELNSRLFQKDGIPFDMPFQDNAFVVGNLIHCVNDVDTAGAECLDATPLKNILRSPIAKTHLGIKTIENLVYPHIRTESSPYKYLWLPLAVLDGIVVDVPCSAIGTVGLILVSPFMLVDVTTERVGGNDEPQLCPSIEQDPK